MCICDQLRGVVCAAHRQRQREVLNEPVDPPAQPEPQTLDIEAIRARADAATPGPWAWDEDGFMGCGSVWCASDQDSLFGGPIAEPSGDCYPRGGYAPKEDMIFIAHARTDVPALLADLDAAREELRRVEEERDELRQHILDIDAHATPFGDLPEDPGYVGTYLLTAGALHRALGKVGHSSLKCAAEAERDRMRPVVEKAQRFRRTLRAMDMDALCFAVDTYETQESTDGR